MTSLELERPRFQLSRRSALQTATLTGLSLLTRQATAADPRNVPWLADVQTPPATLPPDTPQLRNLLIDDDGNHIKTTGAWAKRRETLKNWWLDFLGPMPAERKSPPSLTILEEDAADGVVRQLVRYDIEPGITTEAYLLRPRELSTKAPGIVVFHSTVNYTIRQPAGLEGPPEKHFGHRFAKKGCVCFCPRNFLWPNITQEKLNANAEVKKLADRPPFSNQQQPKGMAKMLYDSLVAVDVLASQPQVDASRLGAVGHSLGAKEALYIAAFDDRIKATVSSEGGIGTTFSNWDAPWYLGPSIKEPTFTHEHHELLAMTAPRPFLLLGGNSADGDRGWPFITAALPIYELYGKPARLGQFVHGQGHAVPPEAEQHLEQWLLAYLS